MKPITFTSDTDYIVAFRADETGDFLIEVNSVITHSFKTKAACLKKAKAIAEKAGATLSNDLLPIIQ